MAQEVVWGRRGRLRPEMKGRGRRGPEESEDGLFFLPAVGDEAFCLPEPASVRNAYHRMAIPFCNRLLESVLAIALCLSCTKGENAYMKGMH